METRSCAWSSSSELRTSAWSEPGSAGGSGAAAPAWTAGWVDEGLMKVGTAPFDGQHGSTHGSCHGFRDDAVGELIAQPAAGVALGPIGIGPADRRGRARIGIEAQDDQRGGTPHCPVAEAGCADAVAAQPGH